MHRLRSKISVEEYTYCRYLAVQAANCALGGRKWLEPQAESLTGTDFCLTKGKQTYGTGWPGMVGPSRKQVPRPKPTIGPRGVYKAW